MIEEAGLAGYNVILPHPDDTEMVHDWVWDELACAGHMVLIRPGPGAALTMPWLQATTMSTVRARCFAMPVALATRVRVGTLPDNKHDLSAFLCFAGLCNVQPRPRDRRR